MNDKIIILKDKNIMDINYYPNTLATVTLLQDESNRKLMNRIKILKGLNVAFIIISVLALIYEVSVFSFYLWFLDAFIVV